MAIIQRPPKQGTATTYQGKVAQGYTDILAAEVDADFDAIYAAWNGGVDGVNIAPGSITADKIVSGQIGTRELADGGIKTIDLGDLQVTTLKLADGAVTLSKLDSVVTTAGGDLSGTYPNPAVTNIHGGQLLFTPRGALVATGGTMDMYGNTPGSPSYDPTRAIWLFRLDYSTDDAAELLRQGPSAPLSRLLSVDWVGNLSLTGKLLGGAATGARVHIIPPPFSTTTYNVPVLVFTMPALTTRGGAVLLTMMHTLCYTMGAATGTAPVDVMIFRNGTQIFTHRHIMGAATQVEFPVSPVVYVDLVPAGTYTYDLRVQIGSASSPSIGTAQFGDCVAQEIG